MSLNVTVSINGKPIIRLDAVNRGPTIPLEADKPGGQRFYEWYIDGVAQPNVIRHRRAAGAARLAAKMLSLYTNTQKAAVEEPL